jgi:tetratricopeptide (TPR) repeat protein
MKAQLLFFWLFAFQILLSAQNINQLLRLAQQYEEGGRWKEAQQLYESMLTSNPDHPVIYERLKSLYLNTFSFLEAKSMIERMIKRNPNQPNLKVDLGQVFLKMGEEEKARNIFDQLIDNHAKESHIYHMIASVFTKERMVDEAIETYLKGRAQLQEQSLYAMNLSRLYAARQQFDQASEELLKFHFQNPKQTALVLNQYLQFPAVNTVMNQLVGPVKHAIKQYPMDLDLYRILAKIYEYHDQIREALKTVQSLEEKSPQKNQGEALYLFAEGIFTKGFVGDAKTAYQTILTNYPHFQALDIVLYKLAGCFEAENNIQEAIRLYQRIIHDFPDRHFAKTAALQTGRLEREKLFEPEKSIQTFQSLINKYPGTPESWTAELELSKSYIMINDTSAAVPLLKRNIKRTHPDYPGHPLRALFQLAQLRYFQMKYKQSLMLLDSLAAGKWKSDLFRDPVVNDALNLQFFIESYIQAATIKLNQISKADYLTYQKKYREALTVLDTVLQKDITAPIQGDALMRKGTILMELNDLKNALVPFKTLSVKLPKHVLADYALERCGYLYEALNDPKKALEQYDRILTNYPHSLFTETARKRIRYLEQNAS